MPTSSSSEPQPRYCELALRREIQRDTVSLSDGRVASSSRCITLSSTRPLEIRAPPMNATVSFRCTMRMSKLMVPLESRMTITVAAGLGMTTDMA